LVSALRVDYHQRPSARVRDGCVIGPVLPRARRRARILMSQDYPPIHLPSTADRRVPVSVIILTLDEERNLADCLRSCAWCDDVHVLDSGSRDRTVEIARSFGATVHHHPFESFANQRNWAIDYIKTKYAWQFHLDADERFTLPQVEEMLQLLGPDGTRSNMAAYQVPNMLIFLGKWLRHAGGYPAYQVRLFHRDRCRFVDFGSTQREQVSGPVGNLTQPYLHFSFANGMFDWLTKHNRYSDREACEAVAVRGRRGQGQPLRKALLDKDAAVRRRALKDLTYRLRFRGLWRFLYMYIYGAGWLDGKTGFQYCAMMAMYEYWVELKVREREHAWKERTQRIADKLTGDDADDVVAPPPGGGPAKVDVMIPTLNESAHIARCVTNARSLGNVIVLDSLSTDGTQQLARDAGATVVEHKFVSYSAQKNWGLDNLPFGGEWIFILDADERLTPRLRREIKQVIDDPRRAANGYYINRALVFMGKSVRHGGLYPSWNLRLFRRGKARYEQRSVHEHMICEPPTDYMRGEMVHIRTESVHQYLAKHIRYADLESNEWVNLKLGRSKTARSHQLFKDVLRYRSWLRRELWPRMPLRPLWRFLHMYVVRLGILDGIQGWHLARLMASYEYMIGMLYEDKLLRARFGSTQVTGGTRDQRLAQRLAKTGK
jgi:glycosyltransferase involved in cell wall biosynthesis